MTAATSVSVIMPVYNEARLLAPAVAAVDAFLAARPAWQYEIVIVESGSTDGTGALADGLAESNPRVRVVHEGAKRGFGSGLRRGYAEARCDWLWLVTADLPFPLEAFDEAATHVDTCDAVLSYRASDDRSMLRRLQSAVFNTLVRISLRLPFRSVNSAFKLLRRALIRRLPLESNGWLIDAELLYWLRESAAPYAEIAVPLVERTAGESTVGILTPFVMLRELLRFLRTKDRRHLD